MSTTATPRPSAVVQAATFVVLVYGAAIALALAVPGSKEAPGPVALLTLLVPASVVGILALGRRLRGGRPNPHPFGLRRAGLRWWAAAVALPVVTVGISLDVADVMGVISFHGLLGYVAQAPINLALMTVLLLGEEIGWRGFLLPRLSEVMPTRSASVLTGVLHGLFHVPLLALTASYDSDGSRLLVVPSVVLVISLGGVVFGWLRTRSASLWPVAIAHAAVNTCFIEAPVLVASDPARAAYVTGESGVLTILTVGAAAAWLLARGDWTPAPARPVAAERKEQRADRATARRLEGAVARSVAPDRPRPSHPAHPVASVR